MFPHLAKIENKQRQVLQLRKTKRMNKRSLNVPSKGARMFLLLSNL